MQAWNYQVNTEVIDLYNEPVTLIQKSQIGFESCDK